jgi:D-alanyl-D-alanine dipeptidase
MSSLLVDVTELSKHFCIYPISCKLAYATQNNLVGRVLDGYHSNAVDICLLTQKAAKALCEAQNYLNKVYGYGLYVFDAYRPKRAVNDFWQWSQTPIQQDFEHALKQQYYPYIEKNKLFEAGYIAKDSGHCYGNTIDLTLIDLNTLDLLNMGVRFDFMDIKSHLSATTETIGLEAYQNRKILCEAMERFGFEPYTKEFWHFSHVGIAGREINEPLDIEITQDLKGYGVAQLLIHATSSHI